MKITYDNFVRQLQLHNEKALEYVVDAYGGLLMSIIRKHLFALPDCCEDCLNDVLLKIWENIDTFDEAKNSFKNWAAAIARYRAIDYLRRYHQDSLNITIENAEFLVTAQDPAVQVIRREISEEMDKMLSCLSPEDRELFVRLYVLDESVDDISKGNGLKKAVIYNRVSKGRKKIRKLYGKRECVSHG